ncbi:uroporphyrinogen-III synthase [Microbulbifer sp. HZ11]|uniref:uroporphyrinogen-III synthase n=1 Tax=unclassified Microbulbifer TaxID=2619833 RepID=UPI00068A748D|nr:uroporphyrinogen-III synthase [Microbulbifer sp. HZ11]
MHQPDTHELAGKRILITRPAQQSASWQQLLEAQGARVDSIPLLQIAPVQDPAAKQGIKNLIMDFDQFDHAIFVSQNAVQQAFDWLDDYWPQLPQGPRYYAVGAATARAIRRRGAVPEACAGDTMDSEALLSLASLQNPQGERVIIFRGQGGRPLMGDTLAQRGARLDYCELYQRLLPPQAEQQLRDYRHIPDAITLHSGETLENFHRALSALDAEKRHALMAQPVILPSLRVANHARTLGFTGASAATNAGDSAMLTALRGALSAHDY